MRGLEGKTVIVTGGGGGIGRAVCQRFAEEGSRVAVLDRDESAAQATADLITEAGGKAKAYAADITDYAAITETVAAIENDLGVPTVLVNNAGFDRFMPFLKTEPKIWDQLIAVNLTGALNMHHVVLDDLLAAARSLTWPPMRPGWAPPVNPSTPPARPVWWASARPWPGSWPPGTYA